ncbi:MAG: branched-chain amino acid transport system II carrier protein [Candidatus Endonucleobacter bathymodioli]|uniref:Branched-chain amino acid transport system carrier protein n=1 Tax=Candidatus Endonucleibacter bathymodioli TaxID=539814 RepID=A0AA90NLF1_9GAMM|nr:branched-chain amino acid transport system II carrier protein [Candidatus Endonucleobacter bathymodioli]
MKTADITALGLMTFSLFLGAGNLIFPPMIGQMAGDNTLTAGLGFIVGDVGLTLLALIAISMIGGPDKILQDFPGPIQNLFWITLFIIIGPAFVLPRAAIVTYEIGLHPILGDSPIAFYGFIFTFLTTGMLFTLNPKRIVSTVGKWMTPVLLLLLTAIAVTTILSPQSPVEPARGNYIHQAFSEGVIQGYLTMDALGALGFGWIIAAAIRNLGTTSNRDIARYTAIAGLSAAIGMILVYSAMLYLGATSYGIAPNAGNGGHILSAYVSQLFGPYGITVLAIVFILACLTTCIGVSGAGAEYFHKVAPSISYRHFVIIIFSSATIVATIGLEKLIGITLPIILLFYPVAIAIILITLIRPWLAQPQKVTYILSSTALIFGLLDGAMAIGLMPTPASIWLIKHLPLFDLGMGWIIPGGIALITGITFSQFSLGPNTNDTTN